MTGRPTRDTTAGRAYLDLGRPRHHGRGALLAAYEVRRPTADDLAFDTASATAEVIRDEDEHAGARVSLSAAPQPLNQLLDDGGAPIGIAYQGKHGTGRCWAYWLLVDNVSRSRS